MLQTILTILIAFLGFPVGYFIASKVPEELQQGKKYFILLEKILALTFFVVAMLAVPQLEKITLLFIAIAVFFLSFKTRAVIISIVAIALIIMQNYSAPLLFLYGVAAGTLEKAISTMVIQK
ncbi:MAG TPA: hypothetical protein VJH88_00470 [Candidatus Nanoarchaeia archaeon]|nr:hypothetical protein [Candidatus Nanoarchaeia archaeon]